jgi:hypothetical protein
MRTDDKQVKPLVLGEVISLAVPSDETFLKARDEWAFEHCQSYRPRLGYLPEANRRRRMPHV